MKNTEQMIAEIHAAVVKTDPAHDKLVEAARRVVHARFKTDSWEELKDAIAQLAGLVGGGK